ALDLHRPRPPRTGRRPCRRRLHLVAQARGGPPPSPPGNPAAGGVVDTRNPRRSLVSLLLDEPSRRAPERAPEVTVRVVTEPDGRGRRRRRSIASVITTVVAAGAVVAALLVVGVVTGLLHLNLFATTTIDNSPPAVLKQLNDLTRYTAAQGRYESTIDIQ